MRAGRQNDRLGMQPKPRPLDNDAVNLTGQPVGPPRQKARVLHRSQPQPFDHNPRVGKECSLGEIGGPPGDRGQARLQRGQSGGRDQIDRDPHRAPPYHVGLCRAKGGGGFIEIQTAPRLQQIARPDPPGKVLPQNPGPGQQPRNRHPVAGGGGGQRLPREPGQPRQHGRQRPRPDRQGRVAVEQKLRQPPQHPRRANRQHRIIRDGARIAITRPRPRRVGIDQHHFAPLGHQSLGDGQPDDPGPQYRDFDIDLPCHHSPQPLFGPASPHRLRFSEKGCQAR